MNKCCTVKVAGVLKNPCKQTRFNSDTRDRRLRLWCISESWQAAWEGCKVSMQVFLITPATLKLEIFDA